MKWLFLVVFVMSCQIADQTNISGFIPTEGNLTQIELPDGFAIHYFAEDVPGARSMTWGDGTLFVGSRQKGNVYAIQDADGDHRAETVAIVASGLESPNGVAYKDGDLYVAEISRILRFKDINSNIDHPEYEVLFEDYPDDSHHGWKYIALGPDGHLYVPVGAPCNICDEELPFASITRMNENFTDYEVYAQGIRNTVGFDWHPVTGELWFTDNGRDWLGNNQPPDELNRAPEKGLHFGFPYCHGRDIKDPEFGTANCAESVGPEVELGPHVAALGMEFYTGEMFPGYQDNIFIAEHGSWNRDPPIGYRITTVDVYEDSASNYEVFASGWLQGEKSWGRPVDVLQMEDGSLLVSDDKKGAIYRIYYENG